MRLPRVIHRIWARLGGYFWLACPRCGREFGGHEWDRAGFPTINRLNQKAICPECARKRKNNLPDEYEYMGNNLWFGPAQID